MDFKKLLMLTLLAGASVAASCNREGSKTVVLNPSSAAAAKVQFDVLRDSVKVKWRNMTESDDQKIALTRILLREIKGQPGVDANQLQALDRANTRLKTRRYDQQTMSSSDLIDRYDTAQDSLLKAVYPIAAPNGNAPTENTRNFVEGIQQLDASVVTFRVQYNQAAKQHNDYLMLHQTELHSLGGKYTKLKPLPLF